MEQQNINNDISTLPPKAQQQVADFIAFLKTRYKQPQANKAAKHNNIINEPFIGIWEDWAEFDTFEDGINKGRDYDKRKNDQIIESWTD